MTMSGVISFQGVAGEQDDRVHVAEHYRHESKALIDGSQSEDLHSEALVRCEQQHETRDHNSGQQEELEEQKRRAPDCGRSAEPGQNEFRDEGLNLKEKKCAQKNRRGVKQH